jgi:drug/metabolite transporter (DMT)-like permease
VIVGAAGFVPSSVTLTAREPVASPARFDPILLGTLFNVVSALGYTAANVCLRDAGKTCDFAWICCVKAAPTALVAWLLIGRRAAVGLPALPSRSLLPALVVTGLVMQLGGNICFQWALPILGLSLSVPLVFGTLILGSALAGRAYLSEPITPRTAVAMLVLAAAIGILSWGAEGGGSAPHPARGVEAQAAAAFGGDLTPFLLRVAGSRAWLVALAVTVTCFSGFCYAASNVLIRRVAGAEVPLSATLMVMSTTGVVSLGLLAFWRIGWAGMAATTPHEWTSMLLAGAFNALAFFSLGIALERTPVTRTNLINASQVSMSAVAGMLLFGEQPTLAVVAGITLTVFGLAILRRRG